MIGFAVENRGFPTTHWSLVGRSGDQVDPARRQVALEDLLRRYLPALRAHLEHKRWVARDRVEDLVHAFVTSQILEKNVLRLADEARGRFRSFLCTSLDNFVANTLRNERAMKRSPERLVSLGEADVTLRDESAREPSDAFDVAWARQVLATALERMEADCKASGRTDLWELFDGRIRAPLLEHAAPLAYEELVRRYQLASPLQASNLLITAKRMFGRVMREVVGEYAEDDKAIEREIADLIRILSGSRA